LSKLNTETPASLETTGSFSTLQGKKYRLIVAFAYRMQIAYVKFVGTHAEYDKVDAASVDQS
jgi:mRNA-degrading endonuclease HigB of HigAB toxin-antitoxin module